MGAVLCRNPLRRAKRVTSFPSCVAVVSTPTLRPFRDASWESLQAKEFADEIGGLPTDGKSVGLLFQVPSKRCERGPKVSKSNKP